MQRVLFDYKRAANPFFHLYESLWMLAGRDDVAALNRFITDFGTRFAEEDGSVHGAYGHRWRKALGFDQLDAIVRRLRDNPTDRQCVLQMWDGRTTFGSNDLLGDWKDRPCNTQVYFRVRERKSPGPHEKSTVSQTVLDMMITCRSNDIVFGAYGANAVHFSILQEYMAGRIGVEVGRMEQISFNYHGYVDVMDRVGAPSYLETYSGNDVFARKMGLHWDEWDADLDQFFLWHRELVERGNDSPRTFANQWFFDTARPMFMSHFSFKNARHAEAARIAATIAAQDWRRACLQWFEIRHNARSR
jgi:thymidylate synthase